MHIAYFAGSFDPITLGHIALIRSAFNICDKIIVGVGVHHEKAGMFDSDMRIALIERACFDSGLDPERIKVETFSGLLVDAAREAGAQALIRGLRTPSDFDYEISMVDMNKSMAQEIETVFLTAPAHLRNISSSLIRQIAKMGGDVTPFVPPCVVQALQNR